MGNKPNKEYWGTITNTSIEGGKVSPITGIRGDWTGTPFNPIWELFGDDDMAGMFFGNVWKKIIIDRDERGTAFTLTPHFRTVA